MLDVYALCNMKFLLQCVLKRDVPSAADFELHPISIIGDPAPAASSAPDDLHSSALIAAGNDNVASFPPIDDYNNSDQVLSSGEDLPPPPPPGKRKVIVAQRQQSFINVIKVRLRSSWIAWSVEVSLIVVIFETAARRGTWFICGQRYRWNRTKEEQL